MNPKRILSEQIEKIRPTKEEISGLENASRDLIKKLNSKGIKAFVGGSLAKGTLIKKEIQDIDIFVVFDYSEEIPKLEKVLESLKLKEKIKKVHGSRDYFQINKNDFVFEIIPVVKNKDPELAENVTDMSLSHVDYIKNEINKKPPIADEIRLAKSFCKSNRIYGAESYTKGFSGYSLEVLVIHFNGFINFLKKIQKKKIIDPKKYFKNETEIKREINTSKIQCPIILIDPTFKYRNVCAGLSFETFAKFTKLSKEFLKNPSKEFFIEKAFDKRNLELFSKENNARLLELKLSTKRQEGDIAGTKMKKFLDFLAKELIRKDQRVLKKDFIYNGIGKKSLGYIVVKENPEIEVKGPHKNMRESVLLFKKSNKRVFEKKNYFWKKERISVEEIFEKTKKIENEMDVSAKLKIIV